MRGCLRGELMEDGSNGGVLRESEQWMGVAGMVDVRGDRDWCLGVWGNGEA